MTEDFQGAIERSRIVRDRFSETQLAEDPSSVLEYYTELINLADKGTITRQEAAFLIADTMWYKSVDTNPGIESISLDAGELELPDRFEDDELDYRWQRLNTWIEEEKEKYE
ncbi:MAG TPA: hypothetical protein PJ993_00810 [Candidatus Saccharibacteria bacterium]|nr:hypothetical protein [Candidatus Saccharibacteria bacterium]HMT39465.1 hypothetical protein [Candidatus Saccharibacteria bacterium]